MKANDSQAQYPRSEPFVEKYFTLPKAIGKTVLENGRQQPDRD